MQIIYTTTTEKDISKDQNWFYPFKNFFFAIKSILGMGATFEIHYRFKDTTPGKMKVFIPNKQRASLKKRRALVTTVKLTEIAKVSKADIIRPAALVYGKGCCGIPERPSMPSISSISYI